MKIQSRPLIEPQEEIFTVDTVLDIAANCVMFTKRHHAKLVVDTSLKTMEMMGKIYDYSVHDVPGGLDLFIQMKRHESFYTCSISC